MTVICSPIWSHGPYKLCKTPINLGSIPPLLVIWIRVYHTSAPRRERGEEQMKVIGLTLRQTYQVSVSHE